MKILHIINSLGSGGAERLLTDYLDYSSRNSNLNQSVYLLSKKQNRFLKDLNKKQIKLYISNRISLYNPIHVIDLINFIKYENPNIIHAHLFPTFYYVAIIKLFYPNIKYVFTEHNTTNRRRKISFIRPLEKLVYVSFNKIIAVSTDTKKYLVEWLDNSNRIVVIENAINLEKFINAAPINLRSKYNLDNDSFLIVMVARFSPQKNHVDLINAIKLLPAKYHLFLVGEGPLKKNIESMVQDFDLTKRVIFMGFKDNIHEIVKSCNMAILTTFYEGLPISLIEIIASGTPLIYSPAPGLKGVFSDFAYELKDNHPNTIQSAIISQSNLKNDIIKPASLQKYSINRYFNNLIELYKQIL